MGTPGQEGCREVVIPSDSEQARRVQDAIESALRVCQFEEKEIFGIKLALEEAIINAIKHGNQMDPNKKIRISYQVSPQHFEVHIADEGHGFDPEDVPDPMAPENLERPCGRGLLLMRHYMTEVIYDPPGNQLSMTKRRDAAERNGK